MKLQGSINSRILKTLVMTFKTAIEQAIPESPAYIYIYLHIWVEKQKSSFCESIC